MAGEYADGDDAAVRAAIMQARVTGSEAAEVHQDMRKNVLLSRVVIRAARQSVSEALQTIEEVEALIAR